MANDKAQIANIMRELRGVTEVAVRGIGEGVLNAAIADTPVDTGLTQARLEGVAARARCSRGRRSDARRSREGEGGAGSQPRGDCDLEVRDAAYHEPGRECRATE